MKKTINLPIKIETKIIKKINYHGHDFICTVFFN